MIPIQEAIARGEWHLVTLSDGARSSHQTTEFKIRALSFVKMNLNDVDDPDLMDYVGEDGLHWLLKVEVLHSCTGGLEGSYVKRCLEVVDQDGCVYRELQDSHLNYSSRFADREGLRRLTEAVLAPKLRFVGAIAFYLPDEEDAIYYLSVQDGRISATEQVPAPPALLRRGSQHEASHEADATKIAEAEAATGEPNN